MPSRSLGELVVDLEARTSKMEASLDRAGRELKKSRKKFTKEADLIKRAFIGLVSVEALRRGGAAILRTADQMTQLRGRVQNATKATGDFQKVWQQLGTIASSTGTELQTTVEVFQRLTIARAELNATNSQLLKFTKSVQQLGIISGASTGAMSAGLTQLGQGLSAGVLRAEEFNSIVENIPAVAQAIGKGMGLTVGQLRAAVLEGRVLSRDVLDSILDQTKDISAQFAEMPLTIERATGELSTAWAIFIDQLNESWQISQSIAQGLLNISESLRKSFGDGVHEIERMQDRVEALQRLENPIAKLFDFSNTPIIGDLLAIGAGTQEFADELQSLRVELTEASNKMLAMARHTEILAEQTDRVNKSLAAEQQILAKTGGALADVTKANVSAAKARAKAVEDQIQKERELKKELDEQAKAAKELHEQYDLLIGIRNAFNDPNYNRDVAGKTGGVVDDLDKINARQKEILAGVVGIDQATGRYITTQDEANRKIEEAARLTELWEISAVEIMVDTIRTVRGAWSDFFFDVFQGEGIDSFSDFVDTIKDMFLRLIADLAAAWVTSQIFGGLLNIGGASIFGIGSGVGAGIGAAATSSGAGGALAGTIAAGGGGAAIATALPAAAAIPAGVPLAAGAPVPVSIASVSSGAGSAIVGSGIGGLAGAGLAFGPVLAAIALSGTRRTPAQGLQRLQSSGQTEQFSRRGGLALGGAELDPLAAFLEGSGAGVSKVPGLGITAFQSGREDEFEGIGELVKKFRELQELMPELQETAATTFESMDIGADDLAASFLDDGVLGAVESAQLGFVGLGDVSADQFQRIAAAVDSGAIRIEALRGEVEYTEEELGLLGVIGAKSMRDLANETGKTDEQLLRMKETARETLRETGDGFARASREANGAAESVQRLGDEIRSLPAVPIGGGEGRHSGGAFDVRHSGGSFQVSGRPGVDANLVQFMATAGERVRVETPGTTQHQTQSAGSDDVLTSRLDRLITLMEAA